MSETHSLPPDKEQVSRVVEILKALGKVYLSKSQFREAAEKYEHIIRLGVQDAEVYRYLAVAGRPKIYTPRRAR
jgi:predicted ATP-grasp superfamily ATP-dependent carboligase